MIALLVTGRLIKQPQVRVSAKGSEYVTALLSVTVENSESIVCQVIAFTDDVVATLSAMGKGDALSLAGTGMPKVWESADGEPKATISIKADAVLTAYQLQKRRKTSERLDGDGKSYVRPYEKATEAMKRAGEVARVADLSDNIPWGR